jgi:hypothetical protein
VSDAPVPIGLVLDCVDPQRLAEFWAPALGYVSRVSLLAWLTASR